MNRLAAANAHFAGDKALVSKETITIDGQTYPEIIDY
jgi:hypothetical protein